MKHPPSPAWCRDELKRIQAIDFEKDAGDAAYRSKSFSSALLHYNDASKLDPGYDSMIVRNNGCMNQTPLVIWNDVIEFLLNSMYFFTPGGLPF